MRSPHALFAIVALLAAPAAVAGPVEDASGTALNVAALAIERSAETYKLISGLCDDYTLGQDTDVVGPDLPLPSVHIDSIQGPCLSNYRIEPWCAYVTVRPDPDAIADQPLLP